MTSAFDSSFAMGLGCASGTKCALYHYLVIIAEVQVVLEAAKI